MSLETFMDIFPVVGLLFGFKVKYLDGFIVRARNQESVVRCGGEWLDCIFMDIFEGMNLHFCFKVKDFNGSPRSRNNEFAVRCHY